MLALPVVATDIALRPTTPPSTDTKHNPQVMQPQVADCPIAKPGRASFAGFPYSPAPPEKGKTAPIPIGSAEFAGVDPAMRCPLDVGELIALVREPEAS
jgi:hypothetical protein